MEKINKRKTIDIICDPEVLKACERIDKLFPDLEASWMAARERRAKDEAEKINRIEQKKLQEWRLEEEEEEV